MLKPDKSEFIFQEKFREDGYQVFRNGWPDFLIVKNEEIKFVEVKNEDKLRNEQIGIMGILNKLGLQCYVWCPERGLIEFKDYIPLKKEKPKLIKSKPKQKRLPKEDWFDLKTKMLLNKITFASIAGQYGVTRQRIHQIVKKGYPAGDRAKEILDDFYGRLV